jgi:hypothetical protein
VAEVSGFSQFLEFMAGAEFFTLLGPFLLAWMLYYIALEKADFLWGEDGSKLERLPPVISLFLAFFTARFLVMNPWYQTYFSDFFGLITIGLAGVLGLFSVLAFSGYTDEILKTPALVILLLMIAGSAFVVSGGFGPPILNQMPFRQALSSGFNWMLRSGAIWLVGIGAVVWYVARPVDNNGGNSTSVWKALLDADEFMNLGEDDEGPGG